MIEQVSNSIKFVAFFTSARVGKAGLTVTVDVYNPAGTLVVTAGSASAIGGGAYQYTLSSGSTGSEGEYLAIFKTTDTTVDQQHVPALWVVGRAGLENIDAAVSSRSTYAGADTSGTTTLLSRLSAGRATALDNLDATVSSRLAGASYSAPLDAAGVRSAVGLASADLDTQLGTIDGILDRLDTTMELDGAVYRFTANALEQGPTGGGGGLDAAGVRAAVGLASANLDTQLATLATPAQVNAEVLDVLATDTFAEPAAAPAATASLKDKLGWLFALARNKITQTGSAQTLRNDADNAAIATAAVSDDGTTFTRGEWS